MHRGYRFEPSPWIYIIEAICAVALCCGVYCADKYIGRVDTEAYETKSEDSVSNETLEITEPVYLDYDFQANGVIIQTEQYGKCSVQVAGKGDYAVVYQFGKNLWGGKETGNFPRKNGGISYSLTEDGSIIANGSAEGNSKCWTSGKWGEGTTNEDRIFLQEGTYTFSGCPDGGSDTTYRQRLAVIDGDGDERTKYYHEYGEGVTFHLTEPAYVGSYIEIKDGTTVENLRFTPQLEIGDQVTEYEKYRGKQYILELEEGVGTVDITLSDNEMSGEFYTFMSTETSMTVNGFGTLKNSIAPIWHASEPHFAIIDDDGKDDVYSVLMPLLNDRGIPFSTAVIPTRLNTTGFLTTEQLQEIVDAGNKVLCHTKNHQHLLNDLVTYEERYDAIIGGKEMLEELGFEIDTLVYPNGAYNDEVLDIARSAYKYGIATHGETVWGDQRYNRDPINQYIIERVNIGSYYQDETAEEKAQILYAAKENIDVCIEKNRLCVIMTHIGDADKDGIAQIIELIEYIEEKGYRIEDLDTALEAHLQPNEG